MLIFQPWKYLVSSHKDTRHGKSVASEKLAPKIAMKNLKLACGVREENRKLSNTHFLGSGIPTDLVEGKAGEGGWKFDKNFANTHS